MEQELIIAEILKHKPNGIKLYSPIFGNCTLCYVKDESSDICVRRPYNEISYFNFDGVYHTGGECLLFPSNEMRDWSKFVWKKGDILISSDGSIEVIFDKWYDDTYTSFYCKHYLNSEDRNKIVYYEEFLCTTAKYSLEDKDTVHTYIKTIEEKLDGKLNLESLEIEKAQPEFKDGDIVTIINGFEQRCILIFRNIIGDSLNRYCILTKRGLFTEGYSLIDKEDSLLFATEEEKNKLFSALEKEGKAWDSEKKQIVDLKPKVELKPMDWCLMRGGKEHFVSDWTLCQFSHKMECGKYRSVGGCAYDECLPYNDETAHLLGTTDEWKGGEG